MTVRSQDRLPRVAVVTPYHSESLDLIEQCHQSVLQQEWPCLHVLVADGHPHPQIHHWNADHITLPRSHGDIGSTPRLIGSYHAIGLGYDAISFLDADNWYASDHLSNLMRIHLDTGAGFISSGRTLCRLDGSVMGPCPLTDGVSFVDTNCMLFTRIAFPVLHHWVLMPSYGHLIGDRILLHHVAKAGIPRVHDDLPTVYYRCSKAGLYKQLGEEVPQGVQPRPDYEASFLQWIADGNEPLA